MRLVTSIHALWGIFAFHYVRADAAAVAGTLARLVAVAAQTEDADCRLNAAWAQACVSYTAGNFLEAKTLLEHALTLDDGAGRLDVALQYGQDAGIGVRAYLECVLALLGLGEAATRVGAETVERARRLGHPFTLCYALTLSARPSVC